MLEQRSSGILLHPTSLPSRGGIGDLGPAAYEFIDFLAAARQTLWQVLPLAPLGMGNSPYSSTSAFAGNVLLISLDRLAERGLIERSLLASLPESTDCVDYEEVVRTKSPLLQAAAQRFLESANAHDRGRYEQWKHENHWWVEDFVLFDAVRRHRNGESWNKWPHDIAHREPAALERTRREMQPELEVARFLQFAFFEQWRALHQYCGSRGVRIIGDVAIFVSFDSADVWTHRDIFRLNGDLEPEVVAGVPPDAFSETGQRWGNPLYNWDVLRQRGYDWWVQRMRWALRMCDIIRLDHFRGFEQYWEIPASEETAVRGKWVDGPKDDLFHVLRQTLGDLPFIAEDLGMITADVHAMRERLQIPGMRVMQFGFSNPGAHIYLPHKFEANTVVYTGTHDNDTTLGWWKCIDEAQRKHVVAYLGEATDGIHWAMMRAAQGSVANLCVFPLQDTLGLGSEARMNIPSRGDGNWAWRYKPNALTKDVAAKLAAMAEVSDRSPRAQEKQKAQKHGADEFAA